MLQYTVHPPPLSIRSKKQQDKDKGHHPVDRSAKPHHSTKDNDLSPISTSRFAAFLAQRPSPDALAFCSTGIPPHHGLAVATVNATAMASTHPPPAAAPSTTQAAPLTTPSTVTSSSSVFPVSTTSSSSSALPSPTFPSVSASKRIPRSPYISNPRPLEPIESVTNFPRIASHQRSSNNSRLSSSLCEHVLVPGDRVGEGITLQGEELRLVPSSASTSSTDPELEPAKEFEVVRRLGTGSYAVVYLVKEIISGGKSSFSDEGHTAGHLDLDGSPSRTVEYGREYAIKCLSKENLDEDALAAQLAEATIHQSLPAHPNIVTLHRTLETTSFLLLLLEFVPGEDLYYFLEQARDRYEPDASSTPTTPDLDALTNPSQTPPTPSLLASANPATILSPVRLRLVASMFAQMCEAVSVCHKSGVYHRDIKPENFIVTDGWTKRPDGKKERKVVVKLTDFGLSTMDEESSDMDCGSAPYMSYECRNNCSPTYHPRAADVWSLGIVLINMLYHINPWTDTTHGKCSSFELYRKDPVRFFIERFVGMTPPVAEFLTSQVLCILDDPQADDQRIFAHTLGFWIKDNLVDLLAESPLADSTIQSRRMSTSSAVGHALGSVPPSRRPASRQESIPRRQSIAHSPNRRGVSLSRAPSLQPIAYEGESMYTETINEHEPEPEPELAPVFDEPEREQDGLSVSPSRSTSVHKRRKRGARKKDKGGKDTASMASGRSHRSIHGANISVDTLEELAHASQELARQISRASKGSQSALNSPTLPLEPTIVPPIPPLPAVAAPAPRLSKKQSSLWQRLKGNNPPPVVEAVPMPPPPLPELVKDAKHISAKANNVSNLIMGLNASAPAAPTRADPRSRSRGRSTRQTASSSSLSSAPALVPPVPVVPTAVAASTATRSPKGPTDEPWSARGRQPRGMLMASRTWGPAYVDPTRPLGFTHATQRQRPLSPSSTRGGKQVDSSASSVRSSNWRNSISTESTISAVTSSAASSSTHYTRYSNSSARSVSTAATSVSSGSWRNPANGSVKSGSGGSGGGGASFLSGQREFPPLPANVKAMTGMPWELHQMPRGMHGSGNRDDIFGTPPRPRKQRASAKDAAGLGSISEQPASGRHPRSPLSQRHDASSEHLPEEEKTEQQQEPADGPKRVHKDQINVLHKMLSAFQKR